METEIVEAQLSSRATALVPGRPPPERGLSAPVGAGRRGSPDPQRVGRRDVASEQAMRTRRRRILAAAAALAAFAAAGNSADAAPLGHFKTPSHNIVCEAFDAPGTPATLVCTIKTGLKPPPPRIKCHSGDFTDRVISLAATGRARAGACAGDPGPLVGEASARVLAYGATWKRAGLRCASAFAGLTCTNRSGHGFFLSRRHSRRF